MDDLAFRLGLWDFDDDTAAIIHKLLALHIDDIEQLGIDPEVGAERDALAESTLNSTHVTEQELEQLKVALTNARGKYPLVALLVAGNDEHSEHPEEFRLIVTRSVQIAIALAEMGESYAEDIQIACRRARRLKEKEREYAALVPHLPRFDQPLEEIATGLQQLSESDDLRLKPFADRLERWARAVRTPVEGRDKRTVTSPGSALHIPGQVSITESDEFPDVSVSVAASPVDTAYPNAPEEAQHDRSKAGAALRAQPRTTSQDRSDGIGYLRGEQIVNRLEMEAASPPTLHSRLTRHEAASAFKKAYQRADTSSGYLFEALSILTGRRVEHLLSLDLVSSRLDPSQTEYWFHRNGKVALWYRPVLPRFNDLMKLGVLEQSTDQGIAVPLPPKLGDLLLAWLKKQGGAATAVDAADAVKQIASETDKRVTGPRLSKVMPQRLTAMGVDEVDVAWLSGIAPEHCAGLYYSVIPRERLIAAYYAYVDELLKGANVSEDWPSKPPLPSGVVGSRIRVQDEHVTRFFNLEAEALNTAQRHQSAADICVFHNRFTLYTFQLLAFASGIRSITEPFGSLDNINAAAGTLRLLDKANRHDRSDRFISLGQTALGQIDTYNAHLEQLHAEFQYVRPAIAEKISAARSGDFSWLFYFDHRGRIRTVTPRWVLRKLKNTWPLPLNWPRHFHSSWLREQGFGRGVVRAFLGHADNGAPPLSRFDGTSIFEMRQLAHAIDTKIADLNIGVISGWNTRI